MKQKKKYNTATPERVENGKLVISSSKNMMWKPLCSCNVTSSSRQRKLRNEGGHSEAPAFANKSRCSDENVRGFIQYLSLSYQHNMHQVHSIRRKGYDKILASQPKYSRRKVESKLEGGMDERMKQAERARLEQFRNIYGEEKVAPIKLSRKKQSRMLDAVKTRRNSWKSSTKIGWQAQEYCFQECYSVGHRETRTQSQILSVKSGNENNKTTHTSSLRSIRFVVGDLFKIFREFRSSLECSRKFVSKWGRERRRQR